MNLKSICYGAIAALALLCTTTVHAQQVDVNPKPQKISWESKKAFNNNVSYTIVGEKDADTDAVNLFKKSFSVKGGGVKLIIGEAGDAAVAKYSKLIPAKAEGYYLSITPEAVVIAGRDGNGTYYGVQTYIQMASNPEVMCATVTDYPSVVERGLVEGYYGNPFTEANRMELFEFFGRQKMNVYIYGPKDDVYHKAKWREPYPADQAAKLAEYAAAAKANKVDFIWAIHPGADIKWNKADSVNMVNKLKLMYDLGIRTFAVFFDDIWGEGTKAEKQAGIMNYITEELNKAYKDVNPLILCPTQYNKGWTSGDYLSVLGTQMDKSVRIMWTGNSVVDMINDFDMEWINNQIQREAYIWLNYPVTDYCISHLLMGPTYGNDLNIAGTLSGFTSNPMEYAEASKVSLYSIGDYCWNMEAYDSDASWESAIKYIMPKNAEAFHIFCENNVDLGVTGHGLRRYNESPKFVEAKEKYDLYMEEGNPAEAEKAVRAEFDKLISSAEQLLNCDEAPALIEEITPWLQVQKYVGLKGHCVLNMQQALAEGNKEKVIEEYLKYKEYDNAQLTVRSRDFEGSIKNPNPVVATLHIVPFIKSTLSKTIAEYKNHYDYRVDVFPAQVLENGTYYIMHNGKYLTNLKPNTDGYQPVFVEGKDTINPQRQEWIITLDAETERFKIVSAQDNRYLNELCRFSKNNATHPYNSAWNTYNILRHASGKYCIQNAGSAGRKFWKPDGDVVKMSDNNALVPENFDFDIVPIGGVKEEETFIDEEATYYITDGERYLTATDGGPTFCTIAEPGTAQEWKFASEVEGRGNYNLKSADGRYVNELGTFGVNPYNAQWNTYLILMMDGKFSIQTTMNAGENFWGIAGDRIQQDNNLSRATSYLFNIIEKGAKTKTAECTAERTSIDISGKVVYATGDVKRISIYDAMGNKHLSTDGKQLSLDGLTEDGLYVIVVRTANTIATTTIERVTFY